MLKDILNVKNKVKTILEKFPDTRDNDKLLWLALMVCNYNLREELGEHSYTIFKLWLLKNKIPTFESVTRVRRKFQEQGQYVGTKRVHKLNEEATVRDFFKD